MIRLARIELLKLTTIRTGYLLLASAAAITALFSILEAALSGGVGANKPAPVYTVTGFHDVAEGGIWTMIFAAVLGVTIATGEYRFRTATLTYLAVPARSKVLAAKAAVGAMAGAVFTLAGFVISYGAATGVVLSRGHRIPVGDLELARLGAGYLVAGALMGAIGVCVGALIKSQLAAVVGVLIWALIVESVAGGLYHPIWPYLPYTAATTIAGIPIGGGAFGPAHGGSNGGPLPFFAAAALVAGVAAVFGAVASRTTIRADIT
jgi:ABC-type transport system involved in multi-copper enzyme maturation permease subunit